MKHNKKKHHHGEEENTENIYSKFSKGMTKEKLAKKAKSLQTGVPQIKFVPNSKTFIRIMPARKGMDEFYLDSSVHWSLGAESNQVRTCKKVFNKPCKFCSLVEKLNESVSTVKDEVKRKKMSEKVRKISAQRQITAYALDTKNLDNGVQKVTIPKGVLSDLLDIIADDHDGADVISNPTEEGYIVVVKRKGSGMTDTKYRVSLGENWKVPKKFLEQLLEQKPLVLKESEDKENDQEIYEETKAVYSDILSSSKSKKKDDDEDEEDEDLVDDDEDEDDEDEDDEDEDEKPSKKSKKSKDDDEDDDDEDDDDEDDDDEDEKPSKKSKDDDDDDDDDDEDDEDGDDDDDDDDDEDDDDEDDEDKPSKKKFNKDKKKLKK